MSADAVALRVLSLVNQERNSYGLRSNEYSRYHAHCSHKVQRLRQKLKLTHGKGREFKNPPPVPVEKLSNEHLQLSLFEAERAWTHSHELTTLPEAKDNGALRHRATGRFRRAVSHSETLLTQARALFSLGRLSAISFLEIAAYHLTMKARFFLRRDDFDEAVELLSVARYILSSDVLAKDTSTSRDLALYTLFGDEIAPQIRFAAHSLGHKTSYDIDGIVKSVATPQVVSKHIPDFAALQTKLKEERASEAGTSAAGRGNLRPLTWEGEPVPVRNPELVDVFLKVQTAEDAMINAGEKQKGSKESGPAKQRGNIAAYDGVLLALTDAEAVAQKLVESRELSNASDTQGGATSTGRDINFVHAFTNYRLLSRRVERDLLLVESLTSAPTSRPSQLPSAKGKDRETSTTDPRINPGLVKLYDTILQSLEQMRNLPIVDESANLVPSIESRLAFSKAKRVLYLARTYGTLNRHAEALALTSKAKIYLREARSVFSTSPSVDAPIPEESFYPLTLDSLASAEDELTKEETALKMDWYTFNGGAVSTREGQATKKPTFYDIAFNYVELPMDRLQARAGGGGGGVQAPAPSSAPKASPPSPVASKSMVPQTSAGVTNNADTKRRAKVEAAEPPPSASEPKIVQSSGLGLGGILGGWWGRK